MADWYAEGLIYRDFPFYGSELNFRDPGAVGAGQVACFRSETGDMAMFGDFSEDPDILFTAMAPVGKNEGDVIHMTDMAPSRADTLRWSVTGELSFDTYDTDFVETLKSMNAERLVELYQDAYDAYAAG